MSYKLVDQIHRTEMPALTGVEKHVLAYMATHASDDGSRVFCGEKRISDCTNLSVPTVHRATKALRTKGYLVEAGWTGGHEGGSKRIFDIRLCDGCGQPPEGSFSEPQPSESTTTTITESNHNHHSDPLSSNGSGPLSNPLTLSRRGTSAHGGESGVGEVKTAEDFTDDEDAVDPPMVVRQATDADREKFDKGTLKRLPVDVIAAIAGTNGGERHDD
jgi:hypothetical protein